MPNEPVHEELASWWREPPAVASPVALRNVTSFFFILGGIITTIAALTLDQTSIHQAGILVIATGATVSGLLTMAFGHRLPRWGYHVIGIVATLALALLVVLGGGGSASVSLSVAFVFVLIDAAFLFSLRGALLQVGFAEAACAIAMHHVGASAGDIALVQGCTIGMTAIVAWLTRVANAVELDSLTRLLNRRGFDRRLDGTILAAPRNGEPVSVALLDIDHFKKFNTDGGHQGGDRVLVECSAAWVKELPEGSHLSRYGGDEFALLMPGVPLGRATDLVDFLRALVPEGVTVSAGVAGWEAGDTASMLLHRADLALYDAKSAGRDQTAVYGDPDRSAGEMESAITSGEFELHLQPIVRLEDSSVVAHEALLRWLHPRRGLITPSEFLAMAERTGAIHRLGNWVVAEACRLSMTRPGPQTAVCVNLSALQLRNAEFPKLVDGLLESWGMPGRMLIVEVTEAVFDHDDPQILRSIEALRALGVRLAIDDFGSGYSSLGRLSKLPIDIIKLDGSLIAMIERDKHEAPILAAIVTMARSLGVRLIAEHVETPHQAEVLRGLGYDLAQGYLFGEPALPELVAR